MWPTVQALTLMVPPLIQSPLFRASLTILLRGRLFVCTTPHYRQATGQEMDNAYVSNAFALCSFSSLLS